MSDAGTAFVQLVPSMRGFSGNVAGMLTKGIAGPAKAAGAMAGKQMGDGISSGVSGSSGKLNSVANKIGGIFKTALKAGGVAAGLALVAGIGGAINADAVTDKFVASLGGSEFAAELGGIAGELYRDAFGDSVAETGDALKKVFQSGIVDEDATNAQFKAMTARALTFTDVLEQDMDMATQAVSNMLRTGIAKDGTEAFDVLTRGIQQGADKSGDLLETFQEYSVQFDALGLSAADATGLMIQGLKGGARDADTVADALKELAIRGKDGSKASAEGFEILGLSAAQMTAAFAKGGPDARKAMDTVLDGLRKIEDPARRDAAAVALFGTKAEDLQASLAGLDLDTAAAMLGDTAGATDKMASAYDNASTRISSFKRKALHALVTFIGGPVLGALEKVANFLGPKLRGLLDQINFDRIAAGWKVFTDALSGRAGQFDFSGQFGWIQDIGTALGTLSADVSSFFDTLRTGFTENEGTAIESVALKLREFGQFLAANKELMIGAIIGLGVAIASVLVPALIAMVVPMVVAVAPFIALGLAAAALGAGILFLWNNVEGFRSFVNAALPQIAQIFSDALSLVRSAIELAVAAALFIWRHFGDELISIVKIALQLAAGVIMGGLDIIQGVIRLFAAVFSGDWSAAWDAIKQITSGALQIIGALFTAGLQLIVVALRVFWEVVKIAFSAGYAVLKAMARAAWAAIKAVFTDAWAQIKSETRAAWAALQAAFNAGISLARTIVSAGLTAIVGFFRRLPGQVRSAMSSLASTITDPFRKAFGAIKSLWNNTLGGFSFSVPKWIPKVGGNSFSIPSMHSGGTVPGQGDQLILARGGEKVLTASQQDAADRGMNAASAPAPTQILLSADGDQYFMRWIQHMVRAEFGGNVELAFAGGS